MKKSKKSKNGSVTTRTWILFGIFLIVSFYCFKIISAAQKMAAETVIPAPISVVIPSKAPIHKTIKK